MASVENSSMRSGGKRVVSLLPAATEMIAFVGGEDLLVGRGHEDDYPSTITDRPIVTAAKHHFTTSSEMDVNVTTALANGEALYSLNQELLLSLKPEVIVTQALCSVCAVDYGLVYRLASKMDPTPEILSLTPISVEDIITDVERVGNAIGLESEGKAAADSLRRRVELARAAAQKKHPPRPGQSGPRVVFMEWTDPIFCGGHWTPQLIEMAGGSHPLNPCKPGGGGASESFRVTPEEVVAVDPDWIIVCPCGLNIPTLEKELAEVATRNWWKSLRAVREGRVALVDGNYMFNRSGPRIVDALEWLVGLFTDNWSLMPHNFPWKLWDASAGEESANDAREEAAVPSQHANSAEGDELACEGKDNRADTWRQPEHPPEIEEAHLAACSAGERMYKDPLTGFMAFTEDALNKRGTCCGNRCRHCPYGHFNVAPWKGTRVNIIKEPVLLLTEASRIKLKAAHANGHEIQPVFWTGSPADRQVMKDLETSVNGSCDGSDKEIVLVCAFDPRTGTVVGHNKAFPRENVGDARNGKDRKSIRTIMDEARTLCKALMVVPVGAGDPDKQLESHVGEALAKHMPWKSQRVVYANGACDVA